jgi:pilus assembly protein CpaB
MKQKNMILVAVAVACGLAAAVLTSRMSAGNKAKAEETVAVLVAAKDLPVGTWLKKDSLNDYVETKDFPISTAPAAFVADEKELADKRVVRTIRKGDPLNPKDVSKTAAIAPPEGFGMMSIPITLDESVTGFVQPGSKVDILASIPSKRNAGRTTVVTFLQDMLVLAVDGSASINSETPVAPTVGTVSFAVTGSTSELLHAAKSRGCQMRLVLVGQTPLARTAPPVSEKELWALLADAPVEDAGGGGEPGNEKKPEEDKVQLAVAREDIPAGTELTTEAIDKLFEMKAFAKPAPTNAVADVRQFTGKYLTKELAAGQFLPKSFVGGDPSAKPKAGPADGGSTEKQGGDLAKLSPVKPPVFHDVTIQSANGVRKVRYQVMPNGEYKFLGEIPAANAVQSTPDDDKGKPKAGERL